MSGVGGGTGSAAATLPPSSSSSPAEDREDGDEDDPEDEEEEVDWSDCYLGDENLRTNLAYAASDGRLSRATSLFLDENGIGPKGASYLVDALLPPLASSSTSRNGDGGGDDDCRRRSSSRNLRLRCLNLGGNPLGPEGASTVASLLRLRRTRGDHDGDGVEGGDGGDGGSGGGATNTLSLRTLIMYNCSLGPRGASSLARALTKDDGGNDSLTALYIEMNGIGGIGVGGARVDQSSGTASLGDMLATNDTLLVLDLTENDIDEDGAALLSTGLMRNSTLTELNLNRNPLGDAGAASISNALRTNPRCALKRLRLICCGIGDVGAASVARCLVVDAGADGVSSSSSSLQAIDLDLNEIGDAGAITLASALRRTNATLLELGLSCNDDITIHRGGRALAAALFECANVRTAFESSNHSLVRLDVINRSIGSSSAVWRSICKSLQWNKLGSTESRRRKVACVLDANPLSEAVLDVDRSPVIIPTLLERVARDCEWSTLFAMLRELLDVIFVFS